MMIRRGFTILLALVLGLMVATAAFADTPDNQEWCDANPDQCSTSG